MIRQLSLTDVGPARKLEFDFAPRLNILTGDNGLGKSFVLDILWWVLTTTWSGRKALPWVPPETIGFDEEAETPDEELHPSIRATLGDRMADDSSSVLRTGADFEWTSQDWVHLPFGLRAEIRRHLAAEATIPGPGDEGPQRPPSLVIYARVDGSFAIWDAYQTKGRIDTFADAAILLSPDEVWGGKFQPDPAAPGGRRTVSAGLIADVVAWQQRDSSAELSDLRKVLGVLSPPDEPLVLGVPRRVYIDDRRDVPTVSMSYGTVPMSLASAGMQRALALAYLIVWSWSEHEKAAKLARRRPTRDVVVLLDEPEVHQHPSWQRAFLPAVLKAVSMIARNADVQLVTATHSPLVLASLEPHFDAKLDALFAFDLMPRAHRVKVEKMPWRPLGDVSNWLTSDVFDLGYARSREAEEALKKAVRVLDKPDLSLEEARKIHRELHRALGETDPFWARWESFARAKGIEP
jgi:predicted ATPase